ncbi:MAG: acetylornithine deacetylase [Pseudomonadota bacterium]
MRAAQMTSAEILARLIAFDTVSHRSNLALIAWVEGYLAEHGVASHRVPDASGEKASLVASIGPAEAPGYVLSGHTDVVPVEGQDWRSDPFEPRIEDGRLYGRGAADMKGFLACALAAVPRMVGAPLARPIHLAFSYDEEVGCVGVRPMLAEMADWPVRPLGCIVGEPTEMGVVTGHKHKLSKRVVVRGRTGHSSLAPQAVNAAEYAARLVTVISEIGRRLAVEGARDPLYDVAHTTAHVGRFWGGTQLNIVPDRAEIEFEFRAVGADDPFALLAEVEAEADRLCAEMQGVAPEAEIVFEPYSHIPGLETAPDQALVTLVKRLAGQNGHSKVAYSTEGGLFAQMAGIPTVVCGPGAIAQAHKADEFVALAQLEACDGFLERQIEEGSA